MIYIPQLTVIDQHLSSIRAPHCITAMPRLQCRQRVWLHCVPWASEGLLWMACRAMAGMACHGMVGFQSSRFCSCQKPDAGGMINAHQPSSNLPNIPMVWTNGWGMFLVVRLDSYIMVSRCFGHGIRLNTLRDFGGWSISNIQDASWKNWLPKLASREPSPFDWLEIEGHGKSCPGEHPKRTPLADRTADLWVAFWG